MNKTQFNKIINQISTNNKLDLKKIEALTDEVKMQLVEWIVRNRGPIVKELIPVILDNSWLASCGYLYETKSVKGYTFVHTCEHRIK
jgi:hypothetical protein